MYTFKLAVKNCKEYLNSDLGRAVLESSQAPIMEPNHKQILEKIDEIYERLYNKILFKGQLKGLYSPRTSSSCEIFLPDWFAKKILNTMVLEAFCGNVQSSEKSKLQEIIKCVLDLYEIYIEEDYITAEDYEKMVELEI